MKAVTRSLYLLAGFITAICQSGGLHAGPALAEAENKRAWSYYNFYLSYSDVKEGPTTLVGLYAGYQQYSRLDVSRLSSHGILNLNLGQGEYNHDDNNYYPAAPGPYKVEVLSYFIEKDELERAGPRKIFVAEVSKTSSSGVEQVLDIKAPVSFDTTESCQQHSVTEVDVQAATEVTLGVSGPDSQPGKASGRIVRIERRANGLLSGYNYSCHVTVHSGLPKKDYDSQKTAVIDYYRQLNNKLGSFIHSNYRFPPLVIAAKPQEVLDFEALGRLKVSTFVAISETVCRYAEDAARSLEPVEIGFIRVDNLSAYGSVGLMGLWKRDDYITSIQLQRHLDH